MSLQLISAIENARTLIPRALPDFASGTLGELAHAHGLGSLFRSVGVGELLLRGVVDPLFIAQMQSSSAYVFGLSRANDDEKVTSLGGCFWDAVAAEYWDAAATIARLSRMTHDPRREHEDDFSYVAFLMQRYFLAPAADAGAEEQNAHEQWQQQCLERWEEVLEGGIDPRLSLCHALRDRDAEAFEEGIVAIADDRAADLKRRHAKGALTNEELAWLLPIWPEGLALLRLAEREGLPVDGIDVPWVPPVIRVRNPYEYHPSAWRSLEIRPARRSG